MIFILLAVVIYLVAFILCEGQYLFGIVVGTAMSFALTMVMALFGLMIGFSSVLERKNVDFPIYSLKMNDSIQGGFFLGSGNINGTSEYFYYWKDEDGFYRLGKNNTSSTRIKELAVNDTTHPHGHYQLVTEGLPEWYMPSWQIFRTSSKTMLDLYVPKGTIIETYNGN